jgi:hypothetical protein
MLVQQDNHSNRWQEGLLARCAQQQVGFFTQWHEYIAHMGGSMLISKYGWQLSTGTT